MKSFEDSLKEILKRRELGFLYEDGGNSHEGQLTYDDAVAEIKKLVAELIVEDETMDGVKILTGGNEIEAIVAGQMEARNWVRKELRSKLK